MKSLINSYSWFYSFLIVSNLASDKVFLRLTMSREGHPLLINTCHDNVLLETAKCEKAHFIRSLKMDNYALT